MDSIRLQLIRFNNKYLVLWICMFIVLNSAGQQTGYEYATTNCITEMNYDSLIYELAESSSIIGLGEATHGTKEFTEVKLEIIKALVTFHNYKRLLLELGFADCRFLNYYVSQPIENNRKARIVLRNATLGFYYTQEVLDIVEWVREYNIDKLSDNKVYFIGMDVTAMRGYKSIIHYNKSLDSVLKSQYIMHSTINSNSSKRFFRENARILKNTIIQSRFLNAMDSLEMINEAERIYYKSLKKKWYASKKRRRYREELMFQNVLRINKYIIPKDCKIIIFAHNGHVSKCNPYYKSLGMSLNEEFNYSAIGFDASYGSYKSYNIDSIIHNKKWVLDTFVIPTGMSNIASSLDDLNEGVLYLPTSLQSTITDKKVNILSIGLESSHHWSANRHQIKIDLDEAFDAVIIIKKSSPTVRLSTIF